MIIFGLNLSHDEACAAVVDGEVRVAIENERLSRLKHNEGRSDFGRLVPFPSIRYCCDALGIVPGDVDLWVVNSVHRTALDQFRSQTLGIPDRKILDLGVPGHHLAHAYSAYYCAPFEDAAVVVVDTNGGYDYHARGGHVGPHGVDTRRRQENYSIYAGRRGTLRPVLRDWIRPGEIGVGQLYMLYAAALQLTPRATGYYGKDDALAAGGKLMGYAAWDRGRAPVPDAFRCRGTHLTVGVRDFLAHFRARGLLTVGRGARACDVAWAHQLQRLVAFHERDGSLREDRWIALAGEAQHVLEAHILRIAEIARTRTDLPTVCFAGGNALNITALTAVMDRGLFKDIFVQPAANDAGNAIGAALYGYVKSGGRRRPYLQRPYSTLLGRPFSDTDVRDALRRVESPRAFTSAKVSRRQQVALLTEQLSRGAVVAVCRLGSEFGPRALGHRSLLASPTRPSMQATLNRIKGREWYRPVAPVVCEEDFARYFEGPVDRIPFMTLSARVRASARRAIPAVVHVDGTARVQTVSRRDDPFLYAVLKAHGKACGVPVLINTSFNVGGEPIVETPYDAIASFLRAPGVSALLVGNYWVRKPKQSKRRAAPDAPSEVSGASRRRRAPLTASKG